MLLKSQPNQLDYKRSKDKYNKTHTLLALKNTKTQEFRLLHKRSLHFGLKLKLGEWFKLNI